MGTRPADERCRGGVESEGKPSCSRKILENPENKNLLFWKNNYPRFEPSVPYKTLKKTLFEGEEGGERKDSNEVRSVRR